VRLPPGRLVEVNYPISREDRYLVGFAQAIPVDPGCRSVRAAVGLSGGRGGPTTRDCGGAADPSTAQRRWTLTNLGPGRSS